MDAYETENLRLSEEALARQKRAAEGQKPNHMGWEGIVESRTRQYFPGMEPKLPTNEALDFGEPTRLTLWIDRQVKNHPYVLAGLLIFFTVGITLIGGILDYFHVPPFN